MRFSQSIRKSILMEALSLDSFINDVHDLDLSSYFVSRTCQCNAQDSTTVRYCTYVRFGPRIFLNRENYII